MAQPKLGDRVIHPFNPALVGTVTGLVADGFKVRYDGRRERGRKVTGGLYTYCGRRGILAFRIIGR